MKTIVICSGYFDPIGQHHLKYLHAAKGLGDYLYVIVNTDKQALLKKGFSFQDENFRLNLLNQLNFVDRVDLSIDRDLSICLTLEEILNFYINFNCIFANGGDQKDNCRETEICKKYACKIIYGVGGDKTGSSSNILHDFLTNYKCEDCGSTNLELH